MTKRKKPSEYWNKKVTRKRNLSDSALLLLEQMLDGAVVYQETDLMNRPIMIEHCGIHDEIAAISDVNTLMSIGLVGTTMKRSSDDMRLFYVIANRLAIKNLLLKKE